LEQPVLRDCKRKIKSQLEDFALDRFGHRQLRLPVRLLPLTSTRPSRPRLGRKRSALDFADGDALHAVIPRVPTHDGRLWCCTGLLLLDRRSPTSCPRRGGLSWLAVRPWKSWTSASASPVTRKSTRQLVAVLPKQQQKDMRYTSGSTLGTHTGRSSQGPGARGL
jgi:hypothetical protein